MSKPREFWIDNPNEAPTLAYSHPDQVLQSRKATMVHVREVSPELDKAIEGLVIAIEKMLEMYPKEIFDGNSGDEGPQRIVDAYNALAAYHSAKEGEK